MRTPLPGACDAAAKFEHGVATAANTYSFVEAAWDGPVELVDYVRVLRRRWWLVALVIIACVAGAAIATVLTTPEYQSTAKLIVNGSSNVSGVDEIVSRELADQRATAFAQIASTGPAVQAALKQAESTHAPFNSKGSPSVSASATGTSPFITIDVTDSDPRRAEAVANAYAKVLPQVLELLKQPTIVPHEIDVLDPATLSSSPVSPKKLQNLLIGLALGLVLGAGAAFVVESLDRRLKDSDDVENATGLTVLGVVPFEMPGEAVPTETHPMSVRSEAYRKVRTNLAFVTESGAPKSIVITSAASSEGKTSLAVNLAIACARAGQRVVLVDADLRRPMVHTYLQITDQPGLVDVLAGTIDLTEAIRFSEKGHIDVITSGPVPSNPNELIGSETMLKVIRQLELDYSTVIIDTPPVLPVADALHLGVCVDAVVIVTRLGETTRDRLRRSKEALVNVHANIVGVVPNGAIQREDSAYSYAYRYRSRKKAPDIAYAPRDPEVEPRPDDLRPANREDQIDRVSPSVAQTTSDSRQLGGRGRRGKHISTARDHPRVDVSPSGDGQSTNATLTNVPTDDGDGTEGRIPGSLPGPSD
jgi:capsular exopolysaccharide synthesis family protein